jgi:hypothetical protein
LCAEKLQYFPNPDILYARANPNTIGVDEKLTQRVVDLSTTLISEAHVEFCVGVAK